MNQVILNQKTVNLRKSLKKIQKDSIRGYCRGKSISKTKIGKLIRLVHSRMITNDTKCLSSEVNLNRVQELLESNNLTGMSGNGFSVKTKLELLIKNNSSKKFFVINGVECEPGLIHDEWILENHWDEVINGIRIICQAIPFERCVLSCKILRDKKGNKKNTEGFEFCVVPAKYPMGEEHLLIKQVLGKTLQKDEHPTDAGILVMNVQTAYQVYCLLTDQYHNGRYITLADLNSGDARVEYVKRGENIKEKLMKCFPRDTDDDYFAGSGILSAHVIEDDEIFSDEISFAAIGNTTDISNNVACKGCGKCNRNCPAGVNIKKIVKRKEANLQADITDLGTENCIHCGSCTFFCRAGKNIAEYLEK
jgi:Na+-translocating ferredoxin:NAD+ oxidoreductase RnfC subunit